MNRVLVEIARVINATHPDQVKCQENPSVRLTKAKVFAALREHEKLMDLARREGFAPPR